MSENTGTFEDIRQVFSRILDHKPVIQGEVAYFYQSFNERVEQNALDLQKSLDQVQQSTKTLGITLPETMQLELPDLHSKLNELNDCCRAALDNIEVKDLSSERSRRIEDWSMFMKDMCRQSQNVDDDVSNQLNQVSEYYLKLEKDLELSKP
ncbi:DgyrCDS5553 [Dimorphilus gyrociliatus]|uniref:Biogenesis of lysosome-related organelles complex 1 subunit 5 n=1 Tax=Dimorphilus gyrociliatus TaxID=2664684 RepID=A0A7I8VMJ4_9ANNE|nr:DgyrCDS5553 [Dimorphilus gyrociliatus]